MSLGKNYKKRLTAITGAIVFIVTSLFSQSILAQELNVQEQTIPYVTTLTPETKKILDPRAFFVGQVERTYDQEQHQITKVIDFSDYIKENRKVIKSATNEINWDYGRGYATIDTPKTQSVTGFIGKMGIIDLTDIKVNSKNEYGSICVISLDGQPIKTSNKILIQSMTEEKPFGYKEDVVLDNNGNDVGKKKITSLGGYPINILKTETSVTLKNMKDVKRVLVLDEHGYPKQTMKWTDDKQNNVIVKLPPNAIYTVVERGEIDEDAETGKTIKETVEGIDYVWLEGENTKERSGFSNVSFKPDLEFPQNKHHLSGGDWLTNDGVWSAEDTDNPPTAKYEIEVKEGSDFQFYVRKFWNHGPFDWRFDNQEWQSVPDSVTFLDAVTLKQFVQVNWVYINKVNLTSGKHILEIRQRPRSGQKPFGIDCFVLSKKMFSPNGTLKPGQKTGKAHEGWWAFEPDYDEYTDQSYIDLRHLNEKEAGMSGYVYQKDGQMYLGNGEPVNFWGVNVDGPFVKSDHMAIDYFVRKMAKYGVNSVRVHKGLLNYDLQFDDKTIDGFQYFVAACKKNGIYVKLSHYFVLGNSLDQSTKFRFQGEVKDGLKGFLPFQKEGFGYIIWNDELQEAYKEGLKKLLTAPNPYSDVPLIEEPALAIIEIQNEDSLFWFTTATWRWPTADIVKWKKLYGDWLTKKYGSIKNALKAWGNIESTSKPAWVDDYDRGLVDMLGFENLGVKWGATPGSWVFNRKVDNNQFFTELQHGFYQEMTDFLKKELNYKGMIIAGNWMGGQPDTMDSLEHYTYTPGDIMDRHQYNPNGIKDSWQNGYSVNVGDKYTDRSTLNYPEILAAKAVNTKGYASCISEISWDNPTRFKAEGAFLTAAYARLQGIDIIYNFVATADWSVGPDKWPTMSPTVLGQYPAFGLMFRRGDVKEAQVVATENNNLKYLYKSATGAKIYNGLSIDSFRANLK